MANASEVAAPRVLDVGQCDHDHGLLTTLLVDGFGAKVDRAHGLEEAKRALSKASYNLVLVNRQLDGDGSSGIDVVKAIKTDADPTLSAVPVMLISNFADAQEAALAAGAAPGFGKAELKEPRTKARLEAVLG